MARVINPLFSVSASGQIGADMQFRRSRYGNHAHKSVRRDKQNQQPASHNQEVIRAFYWEAAHDWHRLGPDRRQYWNQKAAKGTTAATGWNAFLASAMAARHKPRMVYDIMNLGQIDELTLIPDGRVFEMELTKDGTLYILNTEEDFAVSIIYITAQTDGFEMAVASDVFWIDLKSTPLRPHPGQTLEINVRATPTWKAISARWYGPGAV